MMCKHCILVDEIHSDVKIDEKGICNYCNSYEKIRDGLNDQEALMAQLELRFEEAKRRRIENGAEYDCLVPLSGGKDSSYLVLKLARDFDLKILAITGVTKYSHPSALENVQKLCKRFDVDYELVEAWNDSDLEFARRLFLDMGSVCPACLGALARIFMVAQEKRIPTVVMGDSRDQMFDGNPTLTAAGIRKGHMDNTLEYGERHYWWANTYSKIFEGLANLAHQTLYNKDREAYETVIAPYRQVAANDIPDFIPFYFFMGHNEPEMIRELEAEGWENLDKGLLGHPDCKFQLFSRDAVQQSRSMGVYIREGVLTKQDAVKELIRDLTENLDRDEEKILVDAAKVIGLGLGDFKGCEWLEVGKKTQKALTEKYLAILRSLPETN